MVAKLRKKTRNFVIFAYISSLSLRFLTLGGVNRTKHPESDEYLYQQTFAILGHIEYIYQQKFCL